jgi:hypothetical protein
MYLPSFEQFLNAINTDFLVVNDEDKRATLQLNSVEPHRAAADFLHFSLLFTGQAADYFPQCTYQFSHPILGQFDLFIVPIGPDKISGLMRYEAIFN